MQQHNTPSGWASWIIAPASFLFTVFATALGWIFRRRERDQEKRDEAIEAVHARISKLEEDVKDTYMPAPEINRALTGLSEQIREGREDSQIWRKEIGDHMDRGHKELGNRLDYLGGRVDKLIMTLNGHGKH